MTLTVCERAVRRQQFRSLIEDLGFPATTFKGAVLVGVDAWAPIFEPGCTTPPERGQLLCSLANVLLMATPGGKRRLELWLADGQLHSLACDSEWIQRHLQLYGDLSFLPSVMSALRVVPNVVRRIVLTRTAFVAVGRESIAWTSSGVFVDQDGHLRDRIIVLGPDVDVDIVVHEIAHVWHAPVHESGPAVCAQGEAGLRRLADAQGWADRLKKE